MLRLTGKIYTGLMDPAATDCVLVGGDGVIAAVGEDAKRAKAREIALGARVAAPGFIDAHVHLEGLVQQLTRLMLSDARSLDEVLERVAERAKSSPRERVIVASAWDESMWAGPEVPTRERIDRAAPHHAVILRRVCGHLWVVNSETLRRIAAREDLSGKERERLSAVQRSGQLREDDIALAAPLAALAPGELREGLLKALRHAARLGATAVQDMGTLSLGAKAAGGGGTLFDCLTELDRREKLPIRVVAGITLAPDDETPAAAVIERLRGKMLHPGPVKVFLDGSIGAQTAAVSEPFADDPGNTGRLLWDESGLERFVERLHVAGFQLALHAIGDRAIRQAIDVFGRVLERHPRADHRHRIEHVEIIPPELIDRMSRLGVIASMQPNFVARWHGPGGLYERRLGARTKTLNPFRSILAAGIPLAFGSDGMPFDPLYGMGAAMNHTTPSERLGFTQALHAYTLTAAFAGRIDRLTGSVEPGKQADLVILSGDPAAQKDVRVEEVFVGGKKAKEEVPPSPDLGAMYSLPPWGGG